MDELIQFPEVAALTGIPEATLRVKKMRGQLPVVMVPMKPGSKRMVPAVRRDVVLEMMQGRGVLSYDEVYTEWLERQRNGTLTGRHVGAKGLAANEYGLKKFWDYLKRKQSLDQVRPEYLKEALGNVPIEPGNCHYTQREQMYKAFTSFYKLLIQKGVRNRGDLEHIRELRPRRIEPEKRRVLKGGDIGQFLQATKERSGRTKHYRYLETAAIALMVTLALRREEVITLKVSDLDFDAGIIRVLGKGRKVRYVGMDSETRQALRNYLKKRVKTSCPNLFVGQDGEAMTGNALYQRVRRVSKRAGKEVSPHDLRRTAATTWLNRGMQMHYVQKMLGHSQITTTERCYVSESEMAAAQMVQSWGQPASEKKKPLDPYAVY